MPFVTITDPVEAHRYSQAGLLWFYSRVQERWVALNSGERRGVPPEYQIDDMRHRMVCYEYAILVESED